MLLRCIGTTALGIAVALSTFLSMAGAASGREPGAALGDSTRAIAPAPVVVQGETIFYVQESVYSLSPQERARLISERIHKLYRDAQFRVDSVGVQEAETTSDVVCGDLVLMSVTDRDARAAGVRRQDLAQSHAAAIRVAAERLRREHSLRSLLFGVAWAVVATIVLLLALRALRVGFPRLYALLESWRGTRIRSVRIQRLELFTADRLTDLLLTLARWMRIALVVLLLYIYIPLVLSLFPWTQGYASRILAHVVKPLGIVGTAIVDYLPNVFFIAVILVIAHYAIKLVRFLFIEIGKGAIQLPGFYPDWTEPTYKLVKFLIIAFTAIVVFPYLPGSQSPAFRGVSLFLGLLFSLGSTSAVANIVAGLVLTYTRAFQVGDRVQIGETTGDVIEKTLLVTRIRTIKNVDISVPNSMVLGTHIVNYSSSAVQPGLILHTGVTIGYEVPWRRVHELLVAAARATANVRAEPEPFVLQRSLDDFYVSYEINVYTEEPAAMARTYSELHQNILDAFNEAGVEILSPHYGAVRDGNSMGVPPEYLPAGYQAPAFRVEARRGIDAPAAGHADRG